MARILIIEDEQFIRDTLQDILMLEGFETLDAENGAVGVQLAKTHTPDVIICDVTMPEMDGYRVLEELHQDAATASIPFIFLTARIDRSSIRKGMNLGADDYLTKPFTPKEVLDSLNARLKKQATVARSYVCRIDELAAQLDYQTLHDPLTNLPNRFSLQPVFTELQAIAERNQAMIPLIYLKLDQIPHMAAVLGQDAGTQLLKAVGDRLSSHPCVHTLALISANQIALLATPVLDTSHLKLLVNDIQELFSRPFFHHHHELFLNPRLGVAVSPQHGRGLDALLSHAEMAGRSLLNQQQDGVCFYSPDLTIQATHRLELETELHQALDHHQLQVYYQPQFDLRTGHLRGAEALLRWFHPGRGCISPHEFIPIAEDTGLIVPIGEWVLRVACAQAQIWRRHQANFRVSINLSARQLNQADILQTVLQVLGDTGLPPTGLELELTESMLVQDAQQTLGILNLLKQHSIPIAIDDFGVGYSAFSYLQQFPLDTLKIDRCFVRNLADDAKNQHIVAAVIQMAHTIGLKVVAEGIEQDSELAFLLQLGCDIAQGYWFSRPLAADEFEQTFIPPADLQRFSPFFPHSSA